MIFPVSNLEMLFGNEFPELMGQDGKAERDQIYSALIESVAGSEIDLGRRSFVRRQGHSVLKLSRKGKSVAMRIIRPIARKTIGDNPKISKAAAKALLLPTVTAATASAAPYVSPVVPIALNAVLDEIFSKAKKGFGVMKKSLLPGSKGAKEDIEEKDKGEAAAPDAAVSIMTRVKSLPWKYIAPAAGGFVIISGILYFVMKEKPSK